MQKCFCISLFLLIACGFGYSQNVETDSLGYETFTYKEGDTTYVMKKYFMALLKKGPQRDQKPEVAQRIQTEHLAHMEKLHKAGYINIAGPFADNQEMQGMVIYSVPTLEDALKMTQEDPAVKAGRLIIEVHPFWAAKGSQLN